MIEKNFSVKKIAGMVITTAIFSVSTVAINAEEKEWSLEEIIVTAQKREETVQSTPLSVSAISSEMLSRGGVADISRLKLLTPGLNFGQTGANAQLAIRGARTEGILANVQPVISYYSDGIYRSGTLQAGAPMIDLKRVEVLRGPQGTLFGRNSYGGAINVITNRPSQEFDMGVSTTLGDYSRRDYQGFINAALTETISTRLAAAHFEHDGYVKNTFNRSEDIKDQDDDYLRGSLLWQPNDTVSLLVRAEYWTQGGNGSADFNYYSPGTPENNSAFGRALPLNVLGGTADGNIADRSPFSIARDVDFILDAEQNIFSAELDWQLAFAAMKIIAAHTEYENFHTNDIDMGPEETGREGQYDELKTDQLEVHFTDNGDGPLQWLVGAFYLKEDNLDSFYFECTTVFECYFANRRNLETDSWAAFSQVTVPLMDNRLRLTAGLRYSDEDASQRLRSRYRDETFASPGTNAPADFRDTSFDPSNIDNDIFEDVNLEGNFDPVTWRLAVDYDLSDGQLIYASVSTGYSSGGFNAASNPLTGELVFPEQNITAYEIGSKNSFLDSTMTVNVALFFNDFEEMLSEPAANVNGVTIIYNDAGGDGDALGLDVELDWMPNESMLINLRASWLDAKYGNFKTGTGSGLTQGNTTVTTTSGDVIPFVDVSGKRIAFSPEYTLGLTVEYRFNLASYGSLTPSVQYYYSADYMTADQHYPFARQDAYGKTDLRISWISPEEHWTVTGFIQNIEDEEVILRTNIFTNSQIGQTYADPSIYGVTLGYSF